MSDLRFWLTVAGWTVVVLGIVGSLVLQGRDAGKALQSFERAREAESLSWPEDDAA